MQVHAKFNLGMARPNCHTHLTMIKAPVILQTNTFDRQVLRRSFDEQSALPQSLFPDVSTQSLAKRATHQNSTGGHPP